MESTVIDEGNPVGGEVTKASEFECGKLCDSRKGCNSFAFCLEKPGKINCYTKDKILKGNEPTKQPSNCASYRRIHGS